MYENIDDRAFIRRKQYFVLNVFLRLTHLGWDYYYLFFKIKHHASLTHIASFRLMTPRLVGHKALGVETPLQA